MLNPITRESLYQNLARMTGLTLIMTCVVFQRRGLMHWTEVAFLLICIGLQETYLRAGGFKRIRTPLLVTYSFLPLVLTIYHSPEISSHSDNFVNVILLTPLPLVLTSVQIMVLYVREAARLVSVVLVLCLFSVVIGLRRAVHDSVWTWILFICALAALYLLLQYPSLLYQGVYRTRKPGPVPPSGQPGGIMRGLFAATVPAILTAVLLVSVSLYFFLPRVDLKSAAPEPTVRMIDATSDSGRSSEDPDGPDRNGGNSRTNPRDNGGISGMSDGVDLGDFGRIKLDESIALVVEEVAPRQNPPPIYMRAFTFAKFDGEKWQALKNDARYLDELPYTERRGLMDDYEGREFGVDERSFLVTPEKESLGVDGQMPVPAYPIFISDFNGPLTYDWMQDTLRTKDAGSLKSYVVTSNMPVLKANKLDQILRGRGKGRGFHREYTIILPSLASEIEKQFKPFDYFKRLVNSRGAHFACKELVRMFKDETTRSGEKAWVYSLEDRPAPGKAAIARFLNTSNQGERVGHCEYFATAMAMLMRMFGFPARVATGFVGQTQTELGKWELRGKNAHAWVEVHYDSVGWVRYDPTPPDISVSAEPDPEVPAPEPAPTEVDQPPEEDPEEPDEPEPTVEETEDWFNEYDRDTQEKMYSGIANWFGGISDGLNSALSGIMGWMPLDIHPVLKLILFFTPVGLLLVVTGLFRRRKKRRVMRVLEEMGITPATQRQRGLYVGLLLLLSKHGIRKRRSETPMEFAERVAATSEVHLPLLELTEHYYSFRFGMSREAESEFKQSLSTYEVSLRALGG
ncbi:MAG: transglutaminase TgpA family protein [Planctomycetota bacterium]|jgi:hypothetical protein